MTAHPGLALASLSCPQGADSTSREVCGPAIFAVCRGSWGMRGSVKQSCPSLCESPAELREHLSSQD